MRKWTQEHTVTLDYQTTYFVELNPNRLGGPGRCAGGLQLPDSQAHETVRAARIVLVRGPSMVSATVVQAVFHTQIPETTLSAIMAARSDGYAHAAGVHGGPHNRAGASL